MLLNVSNLYPLELEFQRGKIDNLAVFLSDLLSKTKGFGFKVYNPFESESWNFKALRKEVSSKGRLYNFSALDVYENLTKANEHLGIPHSIHAHIEGYEQIKAKNNLFTILNKIKSLGLEADSHQDSKLKRSQIFHIAHASSYNIDGNNSELINSLNENPYIDMDLGFIGFDKINPLITSDRRLINSLMKDNGDEYEYSLISSAVEFEGDTFATLRNFDKKNIQNCILWANGIDLALRVDNKWQLQFSVNYPNYANINNVPEITTWLVSKDARDKFMTGMNNEFLSNNTLQDNDKTLTFNEYIIITRASPAKSLGLGNIKGSLGEGADADLNILDLNINEIDISTEYEQLKNALSNIEYVIKSGEIIKQKEKINLAHQGKIFWSKGNVDIEDKELIMKSKKDFYQKYSSMFYESLKVTIADKYLRLIS
jgi:formylmethanofuran dehydrogenase subunit A